MNNPLGVFAGALPIIFIIFFLICCFIIRIIFRINTVVDLLKEIKLNTQAQNHKEKEEKSLIDMVTLKE